MPLTPLDPTVRFEPSEVTKWYWIPTIANYATGPTRTELGTATDLSAEVAESDGFTTKSDMVDTPDYGNKFTSQVPGRISADESTLTMYMDKTGNDARDLLPRGTRGFIVILWGGDVEASKMDVFPVEVSSVSPGAKIGDAATVVFSFAITAKPAQNVAIPAAP